MDKVMAKAKGETRPAHRTAHALSDHILPSHTRNTHTTTTTANIIHIITIAINTVIIFRRCFDSLIEATHARDQGDKQKRF